MRDEVASGKVVGMPQKKKDTGANTGANESADIGAVMAILEQMTPEAKAVLIAKLLAGQTTVTG